MIEINNSVDKNCVIGDKIVVPFLKYNWFHNNMIQPTNFKYENSTVWSFPDRGCWATHTPQYRGNWSPRVVRNIINLYSKKGDLVLDAMVGGGTTPVECKLMGRNSISVDINPDAINITRDRLNIPGFIDNNNTVHKTYVGDARNLDLIEDDSVDLIASHPPYANMIKYTSGVNGDLSLIDDYELFFEQYRKVISEMYRVLKPGAYCAIMIGDTHNKSLYVPLSTRMMIDYLKSGFLIKEDIIKREWNCSSNYYLKKYSCDFLLTAHEHVFIFKKEKNGLDICRNSRYEFIVGENNRNVHTTRLVK